ncbi:MAG TPA: hypothetical protein ENI19_03750 [Candidatus Nealsonbacteria bacterium]|uniref:Uncharacterized protein n=1 Tax=marine sediment metagenome TaxID=412755 RepID=A0A0F9VS29_9ZZZZ|nr:hypothetical protein [Candidatus Nealsonbacteria bacterium]HEB46784.1 hypothetical protein [Candidatus Nealsonbacteria bacterium]
MYHSIIIEESLENPRILENYRILRTKFSERQNWHLHIVEITEPVEDAIKEIQNAMIGDRPDYFHIYDEGKDLIVIFKDKVFNIDPNNKSTWQEARAFGAFKLSIPAEQLDFYPSKISEEDEWYSRE